jgi:hypothetical protein
MSEYQFRLATSDDATAIVKINLASVTATSPMDEDRFHLLHDMSSRTLVVEHSDQVVGFLIGFTDGSAYDSLNYRWFKDRLRHFFYVDRIVISRTCRRSGLGRRFYTQVEQWARTQGLHWLAAELNLQPSNPVSLKFHRDYGFLEVGTQWLAEDKQVSLQVKPLEYNKP